jgi:hypothetical protein
MKKEESLQIAVCNYLRLQYPDVIFTSEASGLKLTMGQAVKMKKMRSESGLPDLMIFKANSFFKGMFIELKNETPFKKDGKLKKDEHLQEQWNIMQRLQAEGYAASFGVGFDSCKEMIDHYMALK